MTVTPASRRMILPTSTRRPPRIGVNLAAMIDVVFLLLIYFMVATDFRKGEEVFRLDLPERQAGANEALYDLAEEPLLIRLREDPASDQGYTVTIEGGWPAVDDAEAVGRFLAASLIGGTASAAAGGDGGYFTADHPVIIVATPVTAWAHVVSVFNAVVGAGYDAVSLDVQ
ncbi:MAG: biopolymer transporter ExbD [Phycisphaerales bacterium]|nr:biopolymer transporter ExbD [Phycisphaerales bacterium]